MCEAAHSFSDPHVCDRPNSNKYFSSIRQPPQDRFPMKTKK